MSEQVKDSVATAERVDVATEETAAPAEVRRATFDDLTRVLANMSEESAGEGQYFKAALGEIASFFASPYAALELTDRSQTLRVDEGGEGANGEFWKGILQDFIGETLSGAGRARYKMLQSRTMSVRAATLAAPLWDEAGQKIGCVVCATEVRDKADARFRLAQLERAAIFLALFRRRRQVAETEERAADGKPDADSVARVSGFRSRTELAYAITNGLRSRTDCDLVSLAAVRGNRVEILSISGADDVNEKSPGVKAMRAAMEEGLDAGMPVAWPQSREWLEQDVPRNHRLHRQWAEAAAGCNVATIPLETDGATVAILALRRPGGEPFNPEQIANLQQTCGTYAPALELVDRANRGLVAHAAAALCAQVGGAFKIKNAASTLIKAAIVALIAWIAIGTVPYEVAATTTLASRTRRQIAAPSSARLVATHVRAGDRVVAGQVLCRFDAEESKLEEARLEAELAVAVLEERRHLSENAAVEARLARARIDGLEASLAITRDAIERSIVRATMDGVILEGDLEARRGDVIPQGESLFEIASEKDWLLEVRIDERDVALLGDVPQGKFACRARPEESVAFSVARMRPAAETTDSKIVFVGEAEPAQLPIWMRAGMEGVATLDVGRRRVWWVAARRAIDWLEMNFWL